MEKITITLTQAGLKKIMAKTGQTEEEVRKAAAENGYEVEPSPKPVPTGFYL